MPRRTDIKSVLIIGAGPIVIGQACEFDYSGAQACKALREEGYRVILVNSNPATIMTDPEMADATYIEPIQWQVVERIIDLERPDALLPTMGGQTALNCALDLARHGVLERYGVEMIGASREAIDKAEDREKFKTAMSKIGLASPRSALAHSMEEALQVQALVGYPTIIRPSFTLGGTGGGIAYNKQEFVEICQRGFDASPTHELLIEESVIGWKEYEMEVVRDRNDNCIIVCSIENLDAMGVHTGDSITVAPAQTLTDKEYQIMRDASIACLREIGVDTGGSNVQFGINPDDGRMVIIEMNPRVSRSSALASKATGFPIAKVAAKLAVGYTLDELRNEITGGATPASFEPTIDYVVTKVPRFAFEKFPQANARLTTQMKSVGEVMAMGRTFQESLQKAMRGLETGADGFDERSAEREVIERELAETGPERLWYVGDAFRSGMSVDEVRAASHIDPWFLVQIEDLIRRENELRGCVLESIERDDLYELKRRGFSDRRLAKLLGVHEDSVRARRHALAVRPVFKRVDTCAAEFATNTAYMYSTYEEECESLPSDRLYFEPLTLEDVLEIVAVEKPEGVIVQFGGQTPLKLARDLERCGVPIIGTTPDMIDCAEDRERFQQMIEKLQLRQPPNRTARDPQEAMRLAEEIGYPLVVRPSYVLGGRAMEIVHQPSDLERYMREAVKVSNDSPVLLDRFLNDAIEVDVDAVSDGERVVIGGIMEHVEQAGVHSGDSACSLPPFSLSSELQAEIERQTVAMSRALNVVGLMNVQFAIQSGTIFVLEVNPRASRTVPFVSKATGVPLAKVAARCMSGRSLAEQGVLVKVVPPYYSVKEAVFPFIKFPGADSILGPEMKSTGEVMGIGESFSEAFIKSQAAAGQKLPTAGNVFLSVRNADKEPLVEIARTLSGLGFGLFATRGTAQALSVAGIPVTTVNKVTEGRPNVVDMIKNGDFALIINTVEDRRSAVRDSYAIRHAALEARLAYYTTVAGARAAATGLLGAHEFKPYQLQRLHEGLAKGDARNA